MKVGNLNYLYKKIFYENCCHSATKLPKPLCYRYMRVVAARWEVAARPQQPHPQPLPEKGGERLRAGWQQSPTPNPSPKGRGAAARRGGSRVVTSNDSPNLFTTVKAAFSCVENIVFQRRKRHFPAW